jgi:hypothetical protein
MANVIGQRWRVYKFDEVKEVTPKKGEMICIDEVPGYDKQVINLIGNGDNVEKLLTDWMEHDGGNIDNQLIQNHLADNVRHITNEERNKWNQGSCSCQMYPPPPSVLPQVIREKNGWYFTGQWIKRPEGFNPLYVRTIDTGISLFGGNSNDVFREITVLPGGLNSVMSSVNIPNPLTQSEHNVMRLWKSELTLFQDNEYLNHDMGNRLFTLPIVDNQYVPIITAQLMQQKRASWNQWGLHGNLILKVRPHIGGSNSNLQWQLTGMIYTIDEWVKT